MQITSWVLWALVLFLQNISFTYVSRARSSGSIIRHLKASIFSNGIWIFSQIIMLGYMFEALTGKHGRSLQVETAVVYTVACVTGSCFAHWLAMKTEKGKSAVGFNEKYAQIPVEEWEELKARLATIGDDTDEQFAFAEGLKDRLDTLPTAEEFQRIRGLAENAYDITVGMIPDSGVSAQKVGSLTVTTGLPKGI